MKKLNFLLILLLVGIWTSAQTNVPLEQILQKEAMRNFEKLSHEPVPAYYISYRVYEANNLGAGSTFGELANTYQSKSRQLRAIVRVGSPELDNTHEIKTNDNDWFSSNAGCIELPIDENPEAISLLVWDYTDRIYKDAMQRYQKVQANVAVKVAAEDKSPDFSNEKREVYTEAPLSEKALAKQAAELEERIHLYSASFKENLELVSGDASYRIELLRSYFVDTEGACITQNSLQYRLELNASAVADDGMNLPLYKSYFAHSFKEMPDNKSVLNEARSMSKMLSDLRRAPVVDTYAGPALLSPEASGVFFHEFFGHRIEGARMKQESDAQTFKKKVGEQVLSKDMTVFFDPVIKYYKKIPLSGSYVFDDEGVRGQRVDIVDGGTLKNFLMSRTPIEGHLNSNGHGRGMIYYSPVTRQSNMIIESSSPKTEQELRTILIEELKKQNKPYGYLFSKVSGGFTNTNRIDANAFNVTPLVVYRIYTDGRPDELVRGVNMIGTPLSMFSQIGACGTEQDVFNGYCGAESGSIPVSCIAPAIYVKMVETQKQAKSQNPPPLLPRPVAEMNAGDDPVMNSIKKELSRNKAELRIGQQATPYFIDYRMLTFNTLNIKATLGSLVFSRETPYCNGMATVQTGDYLSDNQNAIMSFDQMYNYNNYPSSAVFGTNDQVIRTKIWSTLDEKYKKATEQLGNKQSAIAQMEIPEDEKNIPDFEQRSASEYIYPTNSLTFDRKKMETYITEASKVFKDYTELVESNVRLYAGTVDVRYYNTEGTVCRYPNNLIALFIYTKAQSADGQEISKSRCLPYDSFEEMPSLEELQEICRREGELMREKLAAQRVNETYVGPVLFEGEAVADIIEQLMVNESTGLLAKRKPVVSPDIKRYYSNHSSTNGNELEALLNKKVVSRDLTLTSLSGTPEYNGRRLFGYYPVDAQGVAPDKELVLIHDGVLKNMLTTRIPTKVFRKSNGHARISIDGQGIFTLPGVLRLSSKETLSSQDLKKKLIDAAKEEDYDYAYIVRKLERNTAAELYRINVKDGSEVMMRGALVKDMLLRAFKRVSGVSAEENIYNRIRQDVKSTYIVPSAILFDEVDIVKDPQLTLKKNYIVDRP